VPQISAKYWAIYDAKASNFLHGRREFIKREVASLTKIMTCYTVLKLASLWKINIDNTFVLATYEVTRICGTTANLQEGDAFTVN